MIAAMIKQSRGMNTDKQVQRISRLGGAFGQLVDKLLATALLGDEHDHTMDSHSRWEHHREDIAESLLGKAYFSIVPQGSTHHSTTYAGKTTLKIPTNWERH